ncbi:MAG: amidohydrolase [Clostridiales bacterium]
MSIFIKDILYLPMTGQGKIEKGSIRIDGKRIVAMGNNLSPKWGDEIIYGQDKLAMPGFVNCHAHAPMTMLRGMGEGLSLDKWLNGVILPAEVKLTGEDIYLGALLGQLEMLKTGTTCYGDMYMDLESTLWAMDVSGIRGVLARGLTDNKGGGECLLQSAVDFAQKHKNDQEGRVSFMLAPHAVYSCSEDYLKTISHVAQKYDMAIHIHIGETEKEQADSVKATGKRVLKYLEYIGFLNNRVMGAHMIHLDGDEKKLAAQYGVTAVHCPQSNMKLASGIFPYAALKKLGVPMALGTDGAASNNDLDMFEEMRTASLLAKASSSDPTALNAYETLAMATIDGARALCLDNEIGSLEVGKKADINIISLWRPHFYPRDNEHELLSHLAYCAKSGDVHTVIVNGKILIDHGKALYIDEGKLYHDVQKRFAHKF